MEKKVILDFRGIGIGCGVTLYYRVVYLRENREVNASLDIGLLICRENTFDAYGYVKEIISELKQRN